MDIDGLPPASLTGGFRVGSPLPTAVISSAINAAAPPSLAAQCHQVIVG
ncbi:hypothetical protein [Hydrogenispora ethanolica]|jgi:hypothetical protein|nr:hypothetical protein [Hydrogenispora ethanolica]